MDNEIAAVVAEAETERQEAAGETAVELAQIEADARVAEAEIHAEARTAEAEAHAEAAVAIAEAQSGNEEWRAQLAAQQEQISNLASSMTEMAAAISALAGASIQTPIEPPTPEAETTPEPEEPEPETPPSAEAGPRESPEAPAGKQRVRRFM